MYKLLKRFRVIFSLFFLVAITAAFIFFVNRETPFFSLFLKFQFVPSLMGIFTGGALFFVIIILLTLLFGRVYCSSLCPLGTFQDITTGVSKVFKSKKERRFSYTPPRNWLRYSILSATVLFFIGGISYPIALLDPYSNWGRISNELISRSEQLIHNGLALIFPNDIFYRSYAFFALGSFLFALLFTSAVIILSSRKGRLYCNTICPVGSLLGLISGGSLFRPVIDSNSCTNCNVCVFKCKAQCIDLSTKSIDATRCVACFNCMQSCSNGGIKYEYSWRSKRSSDPGKRNTLIALGILGGSLIAKATNLGPVFSSKPKVTGITPPGAGSTERLKKNCTACHACISACPNNIIHPATAEYGVDGILLPVLSFNHHFCSFECNECTKVCPNDALKSLSIEEKQLTQVGQVQFYLEKCIVHTDGTDCGACDEHCPTKAITMVPYGNEGLYIPSVNVNLCIGCGGCEYICPAIPDKAMVIHALPVHGIAEKPSKDKQEKVEVDDFGF